jgi:hypothetical protein
LNTYEEKKAARIARYRELAANARGESQRRYTTARKMADCIPFGQPILIGHHSEQRDRNFRKRIHQNYDKAFKASEKADYYERRAEYAESNRAISSDDPEVIRKIKEKIDSLVQSQETMKLANKAVKKNDSEALKLLGFTDQQIENLMTPNRLGLVGFPSYSLTNNLSNINRLKKRLQYLERKQAVPTQEKEFNGVRIVENVEENRVQIIFPGKPAQQVRDYLKSHGFRWSPSNGCWQRQRSYDATYYAEKAVKIEA